MSVQLKLADNTGRIDTAGDEPAVYLTQTVGAVTLTGPLGYEELVDHGRAVESALVELERTAK